MPDNLTRRDFLRSAAAAGLAVAADRSMGSESKANLILLNGRIATLDRRRSHASAVAIKDGRFIAVGDERDVQAHRGADTRVIDVANRCVIPGLNDSHLHLIRGGLNYNMELRWDGVPSLSDALRMLKVQAERTPPPQWVRVVGGWTEFQFAERRMPTLEEINAVSGDVPVFVLHLYDRAILNGAALRACGYTKATPNPAGGEIQRDKQGNPTGMLIARPNATILYATLARGPKLPPEMQANSTRQFMRELNRLGVTSCIDAGGGYQNYPDDYKIVEELHRRGEMTVRIAYNLFTQRPKQELDDFAKWVATTKPSTGSDFYRMNGAGEMLVYSAADFEDFLEPRPELMRDMESELKQVVSLLAKNHWPFRLHATYDESIGRFLDVFETVNKEVSFDGMRWFFDHAETVTERNLERIKALNGGIAIQHRMAYQGEYFINRYGVEAAKQSPPIKKMLQMGMSVGAGTDATRVASYNPWVSLYWMIAGKTVGGTTLYLDSNRLDRMEALRRYTHGSAWFSGEEDKKGVIREGQLADLAVLSADFFSVPEEEIKSLESVLTVVDGKVVYGSQDFASVTAPALPVLPDWSPVKEFGGYQRPLQKRNGVLHRPDGQIGSTCSDPIWGPGCDCFAF